MANLLVVVVFLGSNQGCLPIGNGRKLVYKLAVYRLSAVQDRLDFSIRYRSRIIFPCCGSREFYVWMRLSAPARLHRLRESLLGHSKTPGQELTLTWTCMTKAQGCKLGAKGRFLERLHGA